MLLKTKRLCEVDTKTERLAQPAKNQSVGRKPKTSGGVTIKHAQASAAHVRKNVITLPRITMEKSQ